MIVWDIAILAYQINWSTSLLYPFNVKASIQFLIVFQVYYAMLVNLDSGKVISLSSSICQLSIEEIKIV